MKRFTKRIMEHVYYTMGQYPETLAAECTSQDVRNILKHLANYEDSNLTPEEISSLITTIESLQENFNRQVEGHNYTASQYAEERAAHNLHVTELLAAEKLIESQKEEIERVRSVCKDHERHKKTAMVEYAHVLAENKQMRAALEKIMDEVAQHTTEQFSDHIHLIGHRALIPPTSDGRR